MNDFTVYSRAFCIDQVFVHRVFFLEIYSSVFYQVLNKVSKLKELDLFLSTHEPCMHMCNSKSMQHIISRFVVESLKSTPFWFSRLAFTQPQLDFFRSEEKPSMPYGFMQMPIGWNGLSMPHEGCSVPIFNINFKVRGVR